jgi:glycosyltransferase involved in cell wall biosynthesis
VTSPLISVLCCAHNEEEYVDKSVSSLLCALNGFTYEIIFVADRCTDKTVEKVKKYKVKLIDKKWNKWKNSYAESLQTGFLIARGVYISIVDADIVVPTNFFKDTLLKLKGNVTSVAGQVVTYPDTLLNRMMNAWEKTYKLAPLGSQPYGAARVIIQKVLDEIDGFRDVSAPDTDIDIRLAKKGYLSVANMAVEVYHIRHISLKRIINGQISIGRRRYNLGISLTRTISHSVFRCRPFTIGGWFMEWLNRR